MLIRQPVSAKRPRPARKARMGGTWEHHHPFCPPEHGLDEIARDIPTATIWAGRNPCRCPRHQTCEKARTNDDFRDEAAKDRR